MNRNEMIDLLIDDDLNSWYDRDDKDDYFAFIMRKGFIGYENWYDNDLQEEMINRGLIDDTHPSFDPVLKNEV
jgi:hypothetical protein